MEDTKNEEDWGDASADSSEMPQEEWRVALKAWQKVRSWWDVRLVRGNEDR